MTINFKGSAMTFSALYSADVFMSGGNYYLALEKMDGVEFNAVNLMNGSLTRFDNEDTVIIYDAELNLF